VIASLAARLSRRLMRAGIALFLLGLLTGFTLPLLANSRMGLSSHLEGVMNGTFLVVLGLLWPKLRLTDRWLTAGFWLALYGTYVNWATTLAAAAWGAGGAMMPLSAPGRSGTPGQEALVKFGLISLSLGIVATCVIVLCGLRGTEPDEA
jgi:(hydroxyamino)benzene mutase